MMALLEEWLGRRMVLHWSQEDGLLESSSRYLARRGRVCWLDFFQRKAAVLPRQAPEPSSDVQSAEYQGF